MTGYLAGDRLVGKVALVTGAAMGMGESHARAMVAQGARVVLADVDDDRGRAVSDELGDAAHFVHLDVSDLDQWRQALAAALDRFGKLNVLVNNAAIPGAGPIGELAPEKWSRVLGVDLTSVYNGVHTCIEALRAAAPSSIINVSSTAALRGYPGLAAYTAAKAGVTGMTRSLAVELGEHNVRCNSVHPGFIDTPMAAGIPKEQGHVALGRIGQPVEVSNLVVFLASDESSYCTGAEFFADGGENAGVIRSHAG